MRFFCFRSMFESAVSPLCTRNMTPAAMLRVGVQHGLPRRGGGDGDSLEAEWRTALVAGWMGDGLEVIARILPILLPFHPHHFTHSLSLTLSHTHSCYDFAVACNGQSLHSILAPKTLQSLKKINPISFLAQRLNSPSSPPPPTSLLQSFGVSRGQLQKASLALP